ncbi:hypothetical protein B0T25DRAFT_244205 [Lasiosphaeria hispida]|uniref:Uncharacterized protein n=1 Tax=Lasiosphaeria hispida TaxID=260671 RepID=A0AAJ0HEP6_9PEZI|nr:hypothetical protein B0T25DRAFT_244205 [Lasiosphaeria hispida]
MRLRVLAFSLGLQSWPSLHLVEGPWKPASPWGCPTAMLPSESWQAMFPGERVRSGFSASKRRMDKPSLVRQIEEYDEPFPRFWGQGSRKTYGESCLSGVIASLKALPIKLRSIVFARLSTRLWSDRDAGI